MFLMKKFSSPCFTLNRSNRINLELGSIIVAFYTSVLHFILLFYGIELLIGGRSDFIVSPFFHADRSLKTLAIITIIFSLFYIISAYLLLLGIKKEIRFLYLFWLTATFLELAGGAYLGGFLIYRYRFWPYAMFALTVLIAYWLYHLYLFLVVLSQYKYLKVFQEPTFILLYA